MRIGLYTSSLPSSHRKPPGVDVFVDRLAERLAARGHGVTVFTYTPAIDRRSYVQHVLEPASTATSRLRRMLIAPVRLNALDTSHLDVFHLHGDDWFYVSRRTPTVRTFHGSALYEARSATRARRRASQYVTYGLELVAARLATGAYGVIPGDGPGYRTSGHLPLAVELPEADGVNLRRTGRPTVLFVGTWAGRKRGELLHRVFEREVLPAVPDARLVMVSDRCESAPSVDWFARPTDAELDGLYRSAWVFCLPSSYEGFGLPYIEAMAHGTPVVAASNPGARFVLEGGRYGAIADEEGLGSRLVTLLRDERERRRLGEAGLRRARDFAWERLIDLHERAYGDAIAAFSGASA